jgi:Peptidase family S64
LGGNNLNSDTRDHEPVRGIQLLEPGMKVSKIGRTTGETEGMVHGCVIQAWIDNKILVNIGIAVIGDMKKFADVGDSGSLVVTAADNYALGMLIRKN